ncbi:MAG: hypothetical protein ACI9H6_000097 [Patiriisocius sp.]|jgi:hypothetical protein
MNIVTKFLGVPLLLLVQACTTPQIAESHQHITADRSHWAVQISMHSGVQGTPTQTVMVVYNKFQRAPIATINGQTKIFSDKLVDAFLALGPAIVHGEYAIQAAEINCPQGTLCGTLVQVSNQSGSNANAGASAGTPLQGS